uniref:PA28_beta domain-containing protein n=1 Tax=Trichuris muris TaxID=70415 RepID=A0A5S6QDG1_TRIMR
MASEQNSSEFSLTAWKQCQDQQIRDLLFDQIPGRVINLLEILNGSLFSTEHYDEFLADFRKLRKCEVPYPVFSNRTNDACSRYAELLKKNPLFSPNQRVSAMSAILEPILTEAGETFERISNWIETLKPEVSSGNNFGVSVQEEVLSEASEMCYASNKMLASLRKYHPKRSALLLFLVKYPFVEDLKEAIYEMDESEFWSLRFKLLAVIDNYVSQLN